MKKIIFPFVVAILFITLGISGCISNDTDDGGDDAGDSSGGIDLKSLNKKIVGTWFEYTTDDDYTGIRWYFSSDRTGYRNTGDSWTSYEFEWETAVLMDSDWKGEQIEKPALYMVPEYLQDGLVYWFSFSNNDETLTLEPRLSGWGKILKKDV